MKKRGTNQGHLDNGPDLIKVVPGFVGLYVFLIYIYISDLLIFHSKHFPLCCFFKKKDF